MENRIAEDKEDNLKNKTAASNSWDIDTVQLRKWDKQENFHKNRILKDSNVKQYFSSA